MDTKGLSILQLVAFVVLMESDVGIIGKAPTYIREKWSWCSGTTDPLELKGIMDSGNQARFEDWRRIWRQ
ncbi:hypothetical protein ES708_10413 [subsurface metagenome]